MSGEKFGEFVRHEREAKELGLREMAKMIGVSPTYLSKVERDECPPPAEGKVRKIAGIIGHDADELLALARPTEGSSFVCDSVGRHQRDPAKAPGPGGRGGARFSACVVRHQAMLCFAPKSSEHRRVRSAVCRRAPSSK